MPTFFRIPAWSNRASSMAALDLVCVRLQVEEALGCCAWLDSLKI